jgi:hypothetical protein
VGILLEVRQQPGATVVVLRSWRLWKPVAIIAGVGLAAVASAIVLSRSPGLPPVPVWMAKFLFTAGGSFVWGALMLSAEFLTGRQVVTASREFLDIGRQVLGWRSSRRSGKYMTSLVSQLRVDRGGKTRPPSRPLVDLCAVAFDHQGKKIQFGVGLTTAEAEHVVKVLRQAMGYPSS